MAKGTVNESQLNSIVGGSSSFEGLTWNWSDKTEQPQKQGDEYVAIWNVKGYASYNYINVSGDIKSITMDYVSDSGAKVLSTQQEAIKVGFIPSNYATFNDWNAFIDGSTYMQIYNDGTSNDWWLGARVRYNNWSSVLEANSDIVFRITKNDDSVIVVRLRVRQSQSNDTPMYFGEGNSIFESSSGSTSIEVITKNVSPQDISLWTYNKSSITDWYNLSLSNGYLDITVNKNSSIYPRYVDVYLGEDSYSRVSTLTQYNNDKAVTAYFTVAQEGVIDSDTPTVIITWDKESSTNPYTKQISYDAYTNVIWFRNYNGASGITVSSNVSWLTISDVNLDVESGTTYYGSIFTYNNFTISITANNAQTREGKITITYNDNEVEEITVIQNQFSTLSLKPSSLSFKADGSAIDTNVMYIQGIPSSFEVVDAVWGTEEYDWCNMSYVYEDKNQQKNYIVCNVSTNEVLTNRVASNTLTLTLKRANTVFTRTVSFSIIQYAALEYQENPIWKDTYYTFNASTQSNYKYYRFINGNKEIYRGKLIFFDETTNIDILVNNIARDYININEYLISKTNNYIFVNNNGYVVLTLQASSDGELWDDIQMFYMYNNYSYNDIESLDISNTIQNQADRRQLLFFTLQDYRKDLDDVTFSVYSKTHNTNDFTLLTSSTLHTEQRTIQINLPMIADVDKIKIVGTRGGIEYVNKTIDIIDRCKNYVVYYMTPEGGWSWMLFDGKQLKQTTITNSTYRRNYYNDNPSNRGNIQYLKELKETWSLTSGYLTDEQSRKFQGVVTSPLMYLHDLENDKIYSVNVSDTSVDEKLRRDNQGRKHFNYTLKIENSQIKIRM